MFSRLSGKRRKKENVKQYLKALNEIISEQSELLSSLDSNELGSIQGKKDLVSFKSKFEKSINRRFWTKYKKCFRCGFKISRKCVSINWIQIKWSW
ncbi:hypothetical protein HYE36_06055 [Mycoplasmopsis bovis]|nr:hypothetical protein [Mycoplasmopsis bovis]WHL49590.1 hypothetical protein HYE36_06055 [Mycoplasmopsis bovis]